MAENKSPNLHLDGLSPEHNIKDHGRSEELPFGMLGSTTDEEYASLTPDQKLGSPEQDTPAYTSKTYLSSISGNSNISAKEGSEAVSSSLSSSDAESVTYDWPAKNYMLGDDVLQPKAIDLEFDSNDTDENLNIAEQEGWEAIRKEDGNTEELLRKLANYEAELKLTKNKLHSAEEEVARFRFENLNLIEELGYTVAKLRSSEDSMEKMEKISKNELEKQQKQFQSQLDLADESIDQLQVELGSERRVISELRETINKTTNDLNDYTRKVEELELALYKAYSEDITGLRKQKDDLELRNILLVKDYEALRFSAGQREKALVDEVKQLNESFDEHKLKYDMLMAEKDEMFAKVQTLTADLNSHDTDILQLEERLNKKIKDCEALRVSAGKREMDLIDEIRQLNDSFYDHKLKYDMLMAEKDETFAKVQTLTSDLNARDTNIQQLEERLSKSTRASIRDIKVFVLEDRLRKLTTEHKQLLDESMRKQQVVETLRLKLSDQEQEMQRQRDMLCDRAEEKREAIRQLCFSLEYYRIGYHELLRKAFAKH